MDSTDVGIDHSMVHRCNACACIYVTYFENSTSTHLDHMLHLIMFIMLAELQCDRDLVTV